MFEASGTRTAPRRVVRGVAGLLAIAAIVGGAVAAGLAIFRAEPEPTLERDLVAVAALENRTGDASLDPLGRQAAALITEAAHQHGVADVVSAEVPLATGDARDGLQGSEVASTLARASGAGVIIHGNYYLAGDSLEFQIQITDVAEGNLLRALPPITTIRERSSEGLGILQQRAVAALAAALDFRAGDAYFPTTPPSLEAYRLYRQGEDARSRWEIDESLEYFEQAQAIDSTWMAPLLMRATGLMNNDRKVEADSLLQLAARYRARMSEPERLALQGLSSHIKDVDPTLKLQGARRLAEIAPMIGIPWAYHTAWAAYRPQETLEYLARVDTASPRFKEDEYWSMTATMHHMLANYETGLDVARDGRRRLPNNLALLNRQLEALAALGRTTEIEALLDTVFALPETERGDWDTWTPHLLARNAGFELRAHGYPDAAMDAFERGLNWLESQPLEWQRQHAWYRRPRPAFLYELGRWEEAADLYQLLAQEADWEPEPDEELLYVLVYAAENLASLAGAAARLGELERARKISVELDERIEKALGQIPQVMVKRTTAWLRLEQARAAAAIGEREEAVELLSEGFRLSSNRGQYAFLAHRISDFEFLHDFLPYQQFLKPRG